MLAVLAALEAGCTATVERSRRATVDVGTEAPHLNLFGGGHTASGEDSHDTGYVMRIAIDGTAVSADDAGIEPAADALYVECVAALMIDPSLGGLCSQIREAAYDLRIMPVEESGQPAANFTLELEVEFRTPDGDPTG